MTEPLDVSTRESQAETLTVVDNRTGRSYVLPIEDGAIRATGLRSITVAENGPGLVSYDPGLVNTAACRSGITYLDGERGVLEPRLPDRAACREFDVPGGGLPAGTRRPADPRGARPVGAGHHDAHVRARERETLHDRLPRQRPPDGHAAGLGRSTVHLLPRVRRTR